MSQALGGKDVRHMLGILSSIPNDQDVARLLSAILFMRSADNMEEDEETRVMLDELVDYLRKATPPLGSLVSKMRNMDRQVAQQCMQAMDKVNEMMREDRISLLEALGQVQQEEKEKRDEQKQQKKEQRREHRRRLRKQRQEQKKRLQKKAASAGVSSSTCSSVPTKTKCAPAHQRSPFHGLSSRDLCTPVGDDEGEEPAVRNVLRRLAL